MFDFLKPKAKSEEANETKSAPAQAAEAVASTVTAAMNGVSPASGKYTVQAGDSLSKIAKKHGVSLQQIVAANPQIKNPDLIHPREVINLA